MDTKQSTQNDRLKEAIDILEKAGFTHEQVDAIFTACTRITITTVMGTMGLIKSEEEKHGKEEVSDMVSDEK